MMRSTTLALAALAALPLATALVHPASAAAAKAATIVAVKLDNTGDKETLVIDQPTIKAGKVTFEVTNASVDGEHEMLIVRTKLKPADFPMNKDKSRVLEDKFKNAHEVSDIPSGGKKELTLELKPGHYVLFCNIKNHFKDGMYGELNVTG